MNIAADHIAANGTTPADKNFAYGLSIMEGEIQNPPQDMQITHIYNEVWTLPHSIQIGYNILIEDQKETKERCNDEIDFPDVPCECRR